MKKQPQKKRRDLSWTFKVEKPGRKGRYGGSASVSASYGFQWGEGGEQEAPLFAIGSWWSHEFIDESALAGALWRIQVQRVHPSTSPVVVRVIRMAGCVWGSGCVIHLHLLLHTWTKCVRLSFEDGSNSQGHIRVGHGRIVTLYDRASLALNKPAAWARGPGVVNQYKGREKSYCTISS